MIYSYRCKDCKHVTTAHRAIDNRNDPIDCVECGSANTFLKITGGVGFDSVYGAGDFPGYMCPVTDTWVDSRKKRKEIMARHNLGEHSSADTKGVHHSGYR